jgi:hypothetical protein
MHQKDALPKQFCVDLPMFAENIGFALFLYGVDDYLLV